MSGEALLSGIANSDATAPTSVPSGRHVSIEERRRIVAESLRVGNPGNNSGALPTQADPRYECQIELAVDDIHPYENNPRRAGNARFAEIKESIRSSGIRNPLTVTRRPGDEHFIVEAGGNTRLLAVQQLLAETRDARFRKLVVLYRPWRSESHVLTSHLIENELRGELTFWDKASGVVALKGRLEAQKGHALSLKQLEDEMKSLGLSVNSATLAHCLFAIERLRTLGEAIDDLSGLDVKTMQPRLNAMKRYAKTRAMFAEADLYATIFEPVFQNAADQYCQSRAFSALDVCAACEEALARQLNEPVTQMRQALDSPTRSPPVSPETSLAPVGADRPDDSATIAPTTIRNPRRSEPAVSSANAPTTVFDHPVSSADTAPSTDENAVMLSRIIEQARLFAGLAGIGDCLRLNAAAPRGYYMDALPIQADGELLAPSRQRAWRLLALVSGQLDGCASASLPGCATEGDFPHPCIFDAEFFAWMVDAHDGTANAFWKILTLIRESLRSTAARRRMSVSGPASGTV